MRKSPQELLKYILQQGLSASFPETHKLLYLVLTINDQTYNGVGGALILGTPAAEVVSEVNDWPGASQSSGDDKD